MVPPKGKDGTVFLIICQQQSSFLYTIIYIIICHLTFQTNKDFNTYSPYTINIYFLDEQSLNWTNSNTM